YKEMPAVLERADAIDPLECRRYVEERFSKERMVADYEAAYLKALGDSGVNASAFNETRAVSGPP
ncbi:MAG TPA: hypothetical protein VFG94_05385, partial [Acidimicrobiales bacterium]|nr:hypothetical protein [Acidimicrobiales bacterium]